MSFLIELTWECSSKEQKPDSCITFKATNKKLSGPNGIPSKALSTVAMDHNRTRCHQELLGSPPMAADTSTTLPTHH